MAEKTVSQRLVWRIMISFFLIMAIVAIAYGIITFYFTTKYFEETTQKLNSEVANHLIDEKFKDNSPFLEDGTVNKPLFGDIMHDMMAVNRGIEVYLVNKEGGILYSVVLDHSQEEEPATKIDVEPIKEFIQAGGKGYILGEDPRNSELQKIFSAAEFSIEGTQGYIYIILAGKKFEEVNSSLIASYFLKVGLGISIATLVFAGILAFLAIWYLTRNLREIIHTVRRFKEGDLESRVDNPEDNDLSVLAETYNDMADTIVSNIEELQSVESLRRELIANVSHDLRTPLAIMQGYVETLQIKKDSVTIEERDKYMDILQKSIEKLSSLINQLFEFSKLEAKQVVPQKEPFHISDLANDVYENYQNMAESSGIKIELEIEEDLPRVFADISLVERVIQNLMDNAMKFTPKDGKVKMLFSSDHSNVHVAIQDSGVGIPEEEQSHIFERFKKSSLNKGPLPGAGLGLAIAKKILEIHESAIHVISKPNEGTTFEFDLPLFQST